jgi:hypothetical protein
MQLIAELDGYKCYDVIGFEIKKLSSFISTNHPVNIHPSSEEYKQYWVNNILKRCIYGYWGVDSKDGEPIRYRYMPNRLCFYVNCVKIRLENEGVEIIDYPFCRDIEWKVGYQYLIMDGFSGMEKDKRFTCLDIVKKIQNGGEIYHREQIALSKIPADVYLKENGEYKEYIDPVEYLKLTFKEPLGKPQYYNENKDGIISGGRGIGKSWILAGMGMAYNFLFYGCRDMQSWIDKKGSSQTLVGSVEVPKAQDLGMKFIEIYSWMKELGSYGDINDIDAIESGLSVNGFFYKVKYGELGEGTQKALGQTTLFGKAKNSNTRTGIKSSIQLANFSNPKASIGKRTHIIYEEAALQKDELLKKFITGSVDSQKRETKMYSTLYTFTGGDSKLSLGVKGLYYNPENYNIVSYTKKTNHSDQKVALFFPDTYKKRVYKDENGNTDLIKAFNDSVRTAKEEKKKGEVSYQGHIVNNPFDDTDMFIDTTYNIFATPSIINRKRELDEQLEPHRYGKLEYNDKGEVIFIPNHLLPTPLYPLLKAGDEKKYAGDYTKLKGAFVEYEQPMTSITNGIIPAYICLYDGVRQDLGSSSVAAFIFKTVMDGDGICFNIVAEWHGRHGDTYADNELVFKMAKYYGAKIVFERVINHTYEFATSMTERLVQYERTINNGFTKITNSHVHIGTDIKSKPECDKLIYGVINREVKSYISPNIKEGQTVSAEDVVFELMSDKIPSHRMVSELVEYNGTGNWDSISAMRLLAVWLEKYNVSRNTREIKEKEQKSTSNKINSTFALLNSF